MHINGHAHIFNLQTVLTEEAIEILLSRLKRYGVHEIVLSGLQDFLWEQLLRPEYLTEDEILRRFLESIARTQAFQDLESTGATLPIEVKLLGTGVQDVAVDALKAALDQLSRMFDSGDGTQTSIFDIFQMLRTAMQPKIVDVADRLLANLGPDDLLVALMMDITSRPERARDRNNFLAQIKGTSDAVIGRPGRILPFVAVNSLRSDHYKLMEQAIESLGFVGVKLYPSLGYKVKTPAIRAVLKYCVDHDVPVLAHCTSGGFYKSKTTREYCNPVHWRDLLDEFPGLRVCFAHFGGWGGFSGHDAEQQAWAAVILELMREHPGVYTDLSYHVEMMRGGQVQDTYLDSLRTLLADDLLGSRIIFGTDAWLVQMQVTDEAYWKFFRLYLTEEEFRKISYDAPRAFLGLPDPAGKGMRENIARHVAFLEQHRAEGGAAPAGWVGTVSRAVFTPSRGRPDWSPKNRAHVLTYKYLRYESNDIPDVYHDLKFAGSAPLRLRQLMYFTKDHGDAGLFSQARRATALKLDAFLTHNGASYEGDYVRAAAIQTLDRLLDDGDRTLGELAASVDAIYLFQSELP
ncbi:MAG TPA: amidohydrolase family protein [Longimicrobiaceae bacterium]|nr:amidohydrolase family protein [Longimicrobiaceae bacterium]